MTGTTRSTSKHPWHECRRVYVEGIAAENGTRRYPSTEEVAEMFNVPATPLRKVCATEDWVGERNRFIAEIAQRRREKVAEETARQGADMATREIKLADGLYAVCAAHIRRWTQAKGPDGAIAPPDAGDMQRIANTLRIAQAVARVALGEADTVNGILRPNALMTPVATGGSTFNVTIVRDGAGYDPPPDRRADDAGDRTH